MHFAGLEFYSLINATHLVLGWLLLTNHFDPLNYITSANSVNLIFDYNTVNCILNI